VRVVLGAFVPAAKNTPKIQRREREREREMSETLKSIKIKTTAKWLSV
jgi:hypothetical protein